MKNLVSVLSLIVLLLISCNGKSAEDILNSEKNKNIYQKEGIIPNSVLESFIAKYPNADDIEWEVEGDIFEAEFEIEGDEYEAEFGMIPSF
jgi:hypothetical protein